MSATRKQIEGYAAVVSAKDPSRMIERALNQPFQKEKKPIELNLGEIETLTYILRDAWHSDKYKYLIGDLVKITKFMHTATQSDRIYNLMQEFKSDLI